MPERRLKAPMLYEVYPSSFRDTTGTGEGDLAGIVEGLDHIASLGADAIWLAPVYASPMDDMGYDVTDHTAINPRYGTLADFDRLVAEADKRGLSIVMDMVLNHTSIEHPWFQAALDGDEDMAARYVWRDPKPEGSPPNNWMSFFGGSAWHWNPPRRQYYMHQYLPEQPALDMRCPDVQESHSRTLAFWRDRGVAGFRFDTVTAYLHDPEMRDNPPADAETRALIDAPDATPYAMQDHRHDLLPGDCARFMEEVRGWAGPDMWLLGECTSGNNALELVREFTGPDRLDALYVTRIPKEGKRPDIFAEAAYQTGCTGNMPWWFSCHDQPRTASALGGGSPEAARFYLALLSVLPGPIMLYQGEELGLPQPELTKQQVKDPFDLYFWPNPVGRAGARVPLPWTEDRPARGFSTGAPWMPMDWANGVSVEAQSEDPTSVLRFANRAFGLRRTHGFATPDETLFDVRKESLTLEIKSRNATFWAAFNFGDQPHASNVSGNPPLLQQRARNGQLGPYGFVIAQTA